MTAFAEMVGKRCGCYFTLDPTRWPFPGFPAWLVVLAVDMPMVKMAPDFNGERAVWINASTIEKIWVEE